MPNWCMNILDLEHEDPKMIEKVKTASENHCLFTTFAPPEVSNRADFDVVNAQEMAWGSKWDPMSTDVVSSALNSIQVMFDTAWIPPLRFYETLYAHGFSVRGYYWEPGMGFGGVFTDGVDDHYGNICKETLNEIPEDLEHIFSMKEAFDSWETAL